MNHISLYFHAGSANHGCEAIVRSIHKICSPYASQMGLFSIMPHEDLFYKLDKVVAIYPVGFRPYSWSHFSAAFKYKILQNKSAFDDLLYSRIWNDGKPKIAISIGGDNYCYEPYPLSLAHINCRLNQRGAKTVLWGCSIEPDLLRKTAIVADLKRYSLITARESITYNALMEAGIVENTKLYPDPAFALDVVKLDLPEAFLENKTVGINISPLIRRLEPGKNMAYLNYQQLVKFIINETDNNVALIPHVVRKNDNDLDSLRELYHSFAKTGKVVLIEDHNCMELKGFISRCRMFVGARTHATIAAYSTCVPTLVVGYSVKSKGIAQDIFGTHENHVIPVQALKSQDDLIVAFKWLMKNEDKIRQHLREYIPQYIAKAWSAGEEINLQMSTG